MTKHKSLSLLLLLPLIFTTTAYGLWASRAVVFNSTSQYAKRDALPSPAPWNALTNWEVSVRVRQPVQYGYLLQISGTHELRVLAIVSSGRYDIHLTSSDTTVYHTPADINDVVLKISYSSATDKVTVTSTKSDGTGSVTSQSGTLGMTAGWNWGGQKFSLNANSYDVNLVGCHVDWVRIKSGTATLAAWEFDSDNGSDSSGNGLTLTLVGSPSFEDSPTETGTSPPDAAPTRLIASSTSPTTVKLYWREAVTNETGFKIERAPDDGLGNPGAFTQIGVAAANAVQYDDSSIAAPAAPTTLSVITYPSDTTLNVATTNAFPSSGYVESDGELIRYAGKTATSFTGCTRGVFGTNISTHAAGARVGEVKCFHYRARATNTGGDSNYTNTFRATTLMAGRVLSKVKTVRSNTRVRVGEQAVFVCTAYDQYDAEIKTVLPQWSVTNGAVAQIIPDGDKTQWDTWTNRYAYVRALAAGTSNVSATVDGVAAAEVGSVSAYAIDGTPVASAGGDVVNGAITKKAGEVVFLDLSGSSNLYEYIVDWGDGDKTTGVGEHAVHAYLLAGTYQLQVTVKNSAGAQATLPSPVNVTINQHTAHTTDGVDVFTATSTADLLAKYNAMPLTGGIIKIAKNTTLSGTVILPERNFSDYVTISSDGVMPDIRNRISNTSTEIATVSAPGTNDIPITVGKRAHHIRFVGVKVTVAASVNTYYGFHIGDHDGTQDTVAQQTHDIILQHCVVDSADNSSMTHGILVDGKRVSVISSWIGNVKLTSQIGGDSTGITTYTGEGLHVFQNNFIESAGECYITGGTSNAMKVTPSGVEFRRNYLTKRDSWTTAQYAMKNHFEIKMGRNIYVEACVMRFQKNNDQFYSIVLKSANQGDDSAGNASEFVRIENCKVVEVQGLFNEAWDRYGYLSIKPRHFSLRNVLGDKIDKVAYGTRGRVIAVGNSDYTDIAHVTGLGHGDGADGGEAIFFDAGNAQHIRVRDSILGADGYGIWKGADEHSGAPRFPGKEALELGTYNHWTFDHNVVALYGPNVGTGTTYPNATPSDHNQYPTSIAAVGFVDYLNGNYRLTPSNPIKGTASDGTDPGINQDLIEQRTAHTQDGQWAPRAVVFNGSGQYGSVVALPSSAPYNSVGAFSIKVRLRNISTYGYVFALSAPDGGNRIYALTIPDSGRIDLHDNRESPALTVYHPVADINDCVVEFKFDPANSRWLVTSRKADGTGAASSSATISNTSNWDFSSYRLSVGANYYGVINPALKVDWFRWLAGAAQLAAYEFDADDGRDSSGNNQHLTLYGSPTFENSPPEN